MLNKTLIIGEYRILLNALIFYSNSFYQLYIWDRFRENGPNAYIIKFMRNRNVTLASRGTVAIR